MPVIRFPNRQQALLLTLVLSIAVALVSYFYVSNVFGRVEYIKAAHYAIEAAETSQAFGKVVTLEPRFQGSRISWDSRKGTSGVYVFYIVGESGEGKVRVNWHRSGDLATFSVTEYEVLDRTQ